MTDSSQPPTPGPAPSPWRRPRPSDSGGSVQPPQPPPEPPPPTAAPDDREAADDRALAEAARHPSVANDTPEPPHAPAALNAAASSNAPASPSTAPSLHVSAAGERGGQGDFAQAFDPREAGHRRGAGAGAGAGSGQTTREVSSTGLSPRVAGVLCYAAGWASGLVLLAMERQSPFVRFHAYQAVAAFGGLTVIAVTCWIVTILMAFMSPGAFRVMAVVTQIAWIALVVTWLFVVVEVSQGKRRKLPLVGKRAERAAAAIAHN